MKNKQYFYLTKDWGIYIGRLDQNKFHRHHAIQLSISLESAITINFNSIEQTSRQSILIRSNTIHQVSCNDVQCILLINPLSHLYQRLCHFDEGNFDQPFIQDLRQEIILFLNDKKTDRELELALLSILDRFQCQCNNEIHIEDERIHNVYEELLKRNDEVISAYEMSQLCCLSESRFLHLFKAQTGFTFRSLQLWNRLRQSVPYLSSKSITEVAHQFGFTDSAHFSRTFTECFGISPRLVLKNSQFIQVSE